MFRLRKSSLALLALLLVLFAFALAVSWRRPREDAFPNARRVGLAVDWSRPDLRRFVWLNTNEILFIREPDAFVLDVNSGAEKILAPMQGMFSRGGRDETRWSLRPSPDGRHVLISSATNRYGVGTPRLVSLPGGEILDLPPMRLRQSFWQPDSRGWVIAEPAGTNGTDYRRFDLAGRELSVAFRTNHPNPVLHGIRRDGFLLLTRENPSRDLRERELAPLNLDPAGPSPEPRLLDLGRPYLDANVILSPLGDRMLLLTLHERALPRVARADAFPWFTVESRRWIGFWSATEDGANATLLETVPDDVWDKWGRRGGNPMPVWYPTGEAFCYRIGSNLWLRAVERPGAGRK